MNGVDSGLMDSDLEALLGGSHDPGDGSHDPDDGPSRIPDSIMLPKCDRIEHLREVRR